MHDCNSEQNHYFSSKALLCRIGLKIIMNADQGLVALPINLRAINTLDSERLEKGRFKSSLAEDWEIELRKGISTNAREMKGWYLTHSQIKVIQTRSVVGLVIVPAADRAERRLVDAFLELFLVDGAAAAFDDEARVHDVVRVVTVVLWHPSIGGNSLC